MASETIATKSTHNRKHLAIRPKKTPGRQVKDTKQLKPVAEPQRSRLSADIDRELLVKLKVHSAVTGTSIATLVQEMISDYLQKH